MKKSSALQPSRKDELCWIQFSNAVNTFQELIWKPKFVEYMDVPSIFQK